MAFSLAAPAFADNGPVAVEDGLPKAQESNSSDEAVEEPAVSAGPAKAGLALYNADVLLCGDAGYNSGSFDDADMLMEYGFEPGSSADEAELYLDGVQGELIKRTIGETEIRTTYFAPSTCVSYVKGPEREAAWNYLRDALIMRHGFALASEDDDEQVLEAEARDNKILRYRYMSSEGEVPLVTIISTIEEQ